MASRDVAIFVMSCDRTRDIAEFFIAGFKRHWADNPYPIFFGTNGVASHILRLDAQPVMAEASNWKDETLQQLLEIRRFNPRISHLIVFLDDFILDRAVETNRVASLVRCATTRDLAYLRMRELEGSYLGRLLGRRRRSTLFGREPCFEIDRAHPYPSSLQIALWNIEYLERLLTRAKDIWAFEQYRGDAERHYSVRNSLFSYKHIVEKGAWAHHAARHCKNAIGWFDPGTRPFLKPHTRLTDVSGNLLFALFGYLPMRLKRLSRRVLGQ